MDGYQKALERIQEAKENGGRRLDLSGLGLERVPEEILELEGLGELHLWGNRLSDIGVISELQRLEFLLLNHNSISEISPLAKLKNLIVLFLGGNPCRDLTPINSLKKLKSLVLDNCGLTKLDFLTQHKRLESLYLSNNEIEDTSVISELKFLSRLDLNNNPIRDLRPLVPHLESGMELGMNLEKWRKKGGIFLGNNPLQHPPMEIAEQGREAVLEYFRQEEKYGSAPFLETKIALVGESESGKTSLMHKLIAPEKPIPKAKSTKGFNIKPWEFADPRRQGKKFRANIWDFGGQEIQYSTHHFFLNPQSCFILLARYRNERTRFEYWFQTILNLGGPGTRVLVVYNKWSTDTSQNTETNLAFYQEQFKELRIDSVIVNLKDDQQGAEDLRAKIMDEVSSMDHLDNIYPGNWPSARDEVEKRRANNSPKITLGQLKYICRKYEIKTVKAQKLFSRALHNRGIIVHYWSDEKIIGLDSLVILDPLWAVDAVYKLLDEQFESNKGVFGEDEIEQCWEEYPDDVDHLRSLLFKDRFEVCFQIRQGNRNRYFAPSLLPPTPPKSIKHWSTQKITRLRYNFKFMPHGIISRLIVQLGDYIVSENGNPLVWNEGAFVEFEFEPDKEQGEKINCRALVYLENRGPLASWIQVEVTGDPHSQAILVGIIQQAMNKVVTHPFRDLTISLKVPCICEGCQDHPNPYFYDYARIVRANVPTLQCQIHFFDVDRNEVIFGVPGTASLAPELRHQRLIFQADSKPTIVVVEADHFDFSRKTEFTGRRQSITYAEGDQIQSDEQS